MNKYKTAGVEPHLDELFQDPIVRLVMRRDSLTEREVRTFIDGAKRRLDGSARGLTWAA